MVMDLPIPNHRPDVIRSGGAVDQGSRAKLSGIGPGGTTTGGLPGHGVHDMVDFMVTRRFPDASRNAGSVWRHRLHLFPAALRAAYELAIARLNHLRLTPRKVHALNSRAASAESARENDDETVDLVAYLVPRVARRLPWRADCLIQAMAAQRWLRNKGVPTVISIGVNLTDCREFEAHAWLKHGDRLVTGGDIIDFSPIF